MVKRNLKQYRLPSESAPLVTAILKILETETYRPRQGETDTKMQKEIREDTADSQLKRGWK